MNNKVYIVTEGEYSEYHIEAVFSTKEKAKEYVQCNGTDYRIEEYDLDKKIERKMQLWVITFEIKDGDLIEANPTYYKVTEMNDTCEVKVGLYCGKQICFYVQSETMDKAIKIASERFAAVKSNDYIWVRLTRPIFVNRETRYERFNIKTNTFI